MVSVLAYSDGPYTAWDFFYFCVFDRFLNIFDVLAIIVLFIDGIDRKKPISLCLVFSWIFRNLGGIIYAIAKILTYDNVESWRYTAGIPSAAWYIGELLLDSYTFQKAYAVSGSSKLLKALCFLGFIPLVLGKLGFMVFRYVYIFMAPTQADYFAIANPFDAAVILATSYSDLLCCIVIVYVGAKSYRFKRSGDDFVSNLVKTTELRMVICTFLAIFAATLILSETGCDTDTTSGGRCQFSGAREIVVNTVYSLYYLDYLVTKYHKVMKFERSGIMMPSPVADKQPEQKQFREMKERIIANAMLDSRQISSPPLTNIDVVSTTTMGTRRGYTNNTGGTGGSSIISKYTTGTLEGDTPSSSDPAKLIPDSTPQGYSISSTMGTMNESSYGGHGRF